MNELISMLSNRAKRGTNTTHKEWFEFQCNRLNLDFDEANQKLRNSRVIHRLSRNRAWPIGISYTVHSINNKNKLNNPKVQS